MQTAQSKAEAYVREKCPELKGVDSGRPVGSGYMDYPDIQLHHWLRVLTPRMQPISMDSNGIVTVLKADIDGKTPIFDFQFTFNLFTGQPKDESDYESFNKIVGI